MADRDRVAEYAKGVVKGKIIAGPGVRRACARHLRDVKEQKARGLVWHADRAQRALDFFHEMLVLESGEPFDLLGWQAFIVGSLFGWYGADGGRRFRTAYIETGKGSGKTPLAAGVGLYCLIADGEPAPEVYSAATSHKQAGIVFSDAMRMVDASPELRDLIKREVGSLSVPAKHAVFRSVSSEHRSLDGLRVHAGLVDELHEHPSGLVVDKIRAGTKGRRNAILFEITNSGWDRESVCWKHHEYSLKVLEDVIENESWFAYVCTMDEKDAWDEEKAWPKTNPSLPSIPGYKYLREQVAEAKGMPSKENIVRRLNFCEWTEQSERAIPMEVWALGAKPVDEAALVGRRCFGGLDLASVSDFAAFGLLFGPDEKGFYDFIVRCWAPEAAILARRELYAPWERGGWLRRTVGNVTDYGFIEQQILDDVARFHPKEIAFDRWNSSYLVTRLQERLAGGPTVLAEFGQGFASMNNPTKELLRLLPEGKIRHGGNPLLTWMASNLALAQDAAGNLKPDKEHSGDKIDGMVALVQALGRAVLTKKQTYRSEPLMLDAPM